MKTLVLDIETTLDHNTIWCCVTLHRETNDIAVWRSAQGLKEYLNNATSIIFHNGFAFDAPLLNRLWGTQIRNCLLYTSPSPRDRQKSRMPSSA